MRHFTKVLSFVKQYTYASVPKRSYETQIATNVTIKIARFRGTCVADGALLVKDKLAWKFVEFFMVNWDGFSILRCRSSFLTCYTVFWPKFKKRSLQVDKIFAELFSQSWVKLFLSW